jgi:molybdate transport system substrate-binding protein
MLRFCLTLALILAGHAPTPAPAATPTSPATASSVSIAAAANLIYVLEALNPAFRAVAPDITVTTALGASGTFVAQIKNGAPYDVFLSADLDYPRALISAGQAEARTLTPFANGRLVLWTTRTDLPLSDLAATVRDPAVKKLALAQPATAPYGRAAQEALAQLNLGRAAQAKIVFGENIAQTAQFIESGHADAGFVALSLVLAPTLKNRGRWLEVPAALHTPLTQGAILTTRGAANPAAVRYLAFIQSATARAILARYGYAPPTPATH